jgi:hypothetical protein
LKIRDAKGAPPDTDTGSDESLDDAQLSGDGNAANDANADNSDNSDESDNTADDESDNANSDNSDDDISNGE